MYVTWHSTVCTSVLVFQHSYPKQCAALGSRIDGCGGAMHCCLQGLHFETDITYQLSTLETRVGQMDVSHTIHVALFTLYITQPAHDLIL
jgi:hypothetical protein